MDQRMRFHCDATILASAVTLLRKKAFQYKLMVNAETIDFRMLFRYSMKISEHYIEMICG